MNLQTDRVCFVRHSDVTMDVRVMKEIRALQDAGFEVDVVCLRKPGQPAQETMDGITFHRIRLRRRRGSRMWAALEYAASFLMMAACVTARFLKRRYALIQVNTMPDFLVFTSLIPKWLGARVLLDLHEPIPEMWMTKFGHSADSAMVRILMAIEQASIRYSDQAITVNRTIRERFISRGADPRKIAVVRNVPEERIARSIARSTSGARASTGLTLVTHGTIEKHYGHEVMIQAVARLRGVIEPLRLIIIGEGNYTPHLQELTARAGCSEIVTFLPWLPVEQLGDVLTRADVGLITHFPSPFIELAQPNKLFEYVALKIAVVTSRFTAVQETFDDSCLMFFEPGDPEDLARCIRELHGNPEKRRWLADNAYRRYRPLMWDVARKDYSDLVRRMTVGRSGAIRVCLPTQEARP